MIQFVRIEIKDKVLKQYAEINIVPMQAIIDVEKIEQVQFNNLFFGETILMRLDTAIIKKTETKLN